MYKIKRQLWIKFLKMVRIVKYTDKIEKRNDYDKPLFMKIYRNLHRIFENQSLKINIKDLYLNSYHAFSYGSILFYLVLLSL